MASGRASGTTSIDVDAFTGRKLYGEVLSGPMTGKAIDMAALQIGGMNLDHFSIEASADRYVYQEFAAYGHVHSVWKIKDNTYKNRVMYQYGFVDITSASMALSKDGQAWSGPLANVNSKKEWLNVSWRYYTPGTTWKKVASGKADRLVRNSRSVKWAKELAFDIVPLKPRFLPTIPNVPGIRFFPGMEQVYIAAISTLKAPPNTTSQVPARIDTRPSVIPSNSKPSDSTATNQNTTYASIAHLHEQKLDVKPKVSSVVVVDVSRVPHSSVDQDLRSPKPASSTTRRTPLKAEPEPVRDAFKGVVSKDEEAPREAERETVMETGASSKAVLPLAGQNALYMASWDDSDEEEEDEAEGSKLIPLPNIGPGPARGYPADEIDKILNTMPSRGSHFQFASPSHAHTYRNSLALNWRDSEAWLEHATFDQQSGISFNRDTVSYLLAIPDEVFKWAKANVHQPPPTALKRLLLQTPLRAVQALCNVEELASSDLDFNDDPEGVLLVLDRRRDVEEMLQGLRGWNKAIPVIRWGLGYRPNDGDALREADEAEARGSATNVDGGMHEESDGAMGWASDDGEGDWSAM